MIKLVSQTRLLGIIIDDSLSWSPHVDSICKKVGRKIGALRRTYRQLTPTARRQFFVSVIQPDLEYAASATIPFMPTGQQDRLLALWKKAVRCLAGVHPHDDVLPLIRNLKLTLLSHRWSLQLFTTIRRCHQQSAPALLLEKLSFHVDRCVAGMRTTSSRHHTWRPDFIFFSLSQVICLGKVQRNKIVWV